MEKVQKDINTSMRAILVEWLVEVAEEYRLVPDTLYLTVNYVDRYLSGNSMDREKLQLVGVACMMIASKYEEISAPQVEEFCYITDNTYFKDEVLEMEYTVLNFLKFELTAPTAKCFLRRFVRAAHAVTEAPAMQLECTTNYLAELTLLEYRMLHYAPSLIAASAIFLARYMLFPSRRPWGTSTKNANVGCRDVNLPAPTFVKSCTSVSNKNSTTFTSRDGTFSRNKAPYARCNMDTSSVKSDGFSVAMDGSMSSSDSLKSPDVEDIDNTDVAAIDSIERRTCNSIAGSICKRDILAEMETCDVIRLSMLMKILWTCSYVQPCKHLRASEVKKRPSTDFMEKVQKDINTSMRAILVDWLVEVGGFHSWSLISEYRTAVRSQCSHWQPSPNGEDDNCTMRELLFDLYDTTSGQKPYQIVVFRGGRG